MAKRTRLLKKTIEQNVLRTIRKYGMIAPGDHVLVGLSGGPDSVFLLALLIKLRPLLQCELGAIHINHSLRGAASIEDEKFCREFCSRLNVQYFSDKKNVKSYARRKGLSIEEAGHEIRYKIFTEIAQKNNFNKIATAHHSDDNAETVLMNILAGTGLQGLTGIAPVLNNVIRPLLEITKSDILEYLTSHHIHYRTDETNVDELYRRNYIRNRLIPEIKERINPSVEKSLLRLTTVMRDFTEFVQEIVARETENISIKEDSKIILTLERFLSLPRFIQQQIIISSVKENLQVNLNFDDVAKILETVKKKSGSGAELKSGVFCLREHNSILLYRKEAETYQKEIAVFLGKKVKFGKHFLRVKKVERSSFIPVNDKNIEYIDGSKIRGDMKIRIWREGDVFFPFGMRGRKKVSDLLTDNKVPPGEKKYQPVLEDSEKILWVIGQRADNRVRVTEHSQIILKMEWMINE